MVRSCHCRALASLACLKTDMSDASPTSAAGPKYPHLLPEVAEIADRADEERIEFIHMDRWVPYERANRIGARLRDLERMPRTNRMQCMLVVGRSNNGKSHILERFAQEYPPNANLGGENVLASVMLMETPPRPDDGELYRQILRQLNRYNSVNHDRGDLRASVVRLFAAIRIKVLVLDEVTYALASTPSQRESFFNGLRYLTNELRISIVCAGTEKAVQLINADSQITTRFQIEALPLWKPDREFRLLLANFEQVIPLKQPSALSAKELALRIHARTDGTIGSVSELLNAAARWAIERGHERIDSSAIEQCAFVPAAERKRLIRDV